MKPVRMVSWVCAICVAMVLAAAGAAAEKRPMTFTDIIEMRNVGAVSISPDRNWVLYTISIPQWKAGKNFTDILAAATDGSSPPRPGRGRSERQSSSAEARA